VEGTQVCDLSPREKTPPTQVPAILNQSHRLHARQLYKFLMKTIRSAGASTFSPLNRTSGAFGHSWAHATGLLTREDIAHDIDDIPTRGKVHQTPPGHSRRASTASNTDAEEQLKAQIAAIMAS